MATWHTLGPFPAAIVILLSLAAGCGGQSEENGSSGGGSGGKSFGGAPSNGGSMTAGGSAQGGAGDGCVYQGKTYRVGETFKVICNTCTCYGMNSVGCTTIACPDDCEATAIAFNNALAAAKRCDPALDTQQCTLHATSLVCRCPTFVNPANDQALMEVSAWRDTYAQNQCDQGITCGACLEPHRGFCTAAGWCQDTLDGGGASCLVNGTVYPHGTTVIKDPFSCNFCDCNDGSLLGCSEIDCDTPCPLDTTRGQRCAQCGLAGGCDIVETGCLPVCAGTCPRPGQSCVNGVCSTLCE